MIAAEALVAAWLVGANSPPHTVQSVMPTDLAQAIARYDRATTGNDVDALGEIVLDDYRLVNSDMSVQDKASYLADFKVPGFHIEAYRLTEPFLILRADSALTGGRFHLGWTLGGAHYDRTLRISHFWVKDRGGWHLAYTQLTRNGTNP